MLPACWYLRSHVGQAVQVLSYEDGIFRLTGSVPNWEYSSSSHTKQYRVDCRPSTPRFWMLRDPWRFRSCDQLRGGAQKSSSTDRCMDGGLYVLDNTWPSRGRRIRFEN